MITVHVLGKIDHLKVECIDNLGENLMVSRLGTNLKSLDVRDVLVSQKTSVFLENIRGQLVNKSLNCSCSMDV